jgi:hypothetical protein
MRPVQTILEWGGIWENGGGDECNNNISYKLYKISHCAPGITTTIIK